MNYTLNNLQNLFERFCNKHNSHCVYKSFLDNCGQACFEFDNCLMGITYSSDNWAPYSSMSIEIRSIHVKMPTTHKSEDLVYFFYDNETTTIEKIEQTLNTAYKFGTRFSVAQLSCFIGKQCHLDDAWRMGIHPDDVDMNITNTNPFVCIGTFAQYYYLSDGQHLFREQPNYVIWNS